MQSTSDLKEVGYNRERVYRLPLPSHNRNLFSSHRLLKTGCYQIKKKTSDEKISFIFS